MIIERGISFDEIHSYHDLNLILSGSEIKPAEAKTTYVDIAGGDGSADLTEANGEVRYQDRTLKFTFTMNPQDDLSDEAWEEKKTEISNILNGKCFMITRDIDPDYYYQGRCTVDDFKSDKRLRQFVVSAKVRPYKLKHIHTVVSIELTEEPKTITLSNSRKSVSPTIECTNDNTVVAFGGVAVNLNAGIHQVLDVYFKEGNNVVTVAGTGKVVFRYQEGDL